MSDRQAVSDVRRVFTVKVGTYQDVGNIHLYTLGVELKILYFGHDTALAKSIQAYSPRTVNGLQVFPAPTYEKLVGNLEKRSFDVVVVEAFNDKSLPENWISLLTKKYQTLTTPMSVPFLYIAPPADHEVILKSIARGYTDVFATPVDFPILMQKLQLYLRDKRFLKENLLFAIAAKEPCMVSISGQILKAAEYGATILTDREFPLDQVLTIHSRIAADDESSQPLLARVVATTRSDSDGSYLVAVTFLGSAKKDLTNIRVWLRKQYVSTPRRSEGDPR